MTEPPSLPDRAREDVAVSGMARFADVEALAFAIVHALEDRDSGLVAEVDALRRQVASLATKADQAMSPTLDATALEALVERQPELRRELNGVVEHLLDAARSGRPAAPTTTALLLLTLPLTQSLTRRHNVIEGEIRALRQEVAGLCEEVSNLGHALYQERGRQPAAPADVDTLQQALRVELAPLRQQVAALDRAGELAALRAQLTELGDRLTATQPSGHSTSLQDAIRSDLARLVERLNAQSRAEQVVALREEVRAQLGTLDQAQELRSLRLTISAELAQLRERPRAHGVSQGSTDGAMPERARPKSGALRRLPRRRSGGRVNTIQGILRALRHGSDELELKMASLRQRGKRRTPCDQGRQAAIVDVGERSPGRPLALDQNRPGRGGPANQGVHDEVGAQA